MAIVVSGIALPFDQPDDLALEQALKLLGRPGAARVFLVKKSLDARRKDRISYVYSVEVELPEGEAALVGSLHNPKVTLRKPAGLEWEMGAGRLDHPPVVAGFGPAGLFAALFLARHGLCPVVLERGAPLEIRQEQVREFWDTGLLRADSNVQFGEGGAGAFSDGKLTTRINDPRASAVLRELADHGAPPEILYQAKPHVGTDLLRDVVVSIRREIERLGGSVRFHTRLEDVEVRQGRLAGVHTSAGRLKASVLILAPGHSARDTFAMLADRNIPLIPKPFSVGVRVEHLQEEIDRALYGDYAGNPRLPRGEYQLSHRQEDRAVYTFCMCPGGLVVPAASDEGMVVTNGMSYHARDGKNANSALVVSVNSGDFGTGPLAGLEFQRELERAACGLGGGGYAAPFQTAGRFLQGKAGARPGRVEPTYARGVKEADFAGLFPQQITERLRAGMTLFHRRLPGFAAPDTVLTGVETRTSSPVRIPRDESGQAIGVEGLYPCGEGAGYAGGIVSAAVDGIRMAQAVLSRYGSVTKRAEGE